MTPRTFKKTFQKLSRLEAFVSREKIDEAYWQREILQDGEILMGIYLNDPGDFFAVTSNHLHWFKGFEHFDIPFALIQSIELPDNPNDHFLILRLENRSDVLLPVVNETDDYPDIFTVQDALRSIVHWPFHKSVAAKIEAIESRDDLIAYLVDDDDARRHTEAIFALGKGFPDFQTLMQSKITPDLLNRAETWRLLALMMSIPSGVEELEQEF